MRESKLKFQVKKHLEELKQTEPLWYYFPQDRFTSGIPDVLGCYYGKFFSLELKAPTKKPRKLQKWVLALIKSAGGCSGYANEYRTVKAFFTRIRNDYRPKDI